MLEVVGAVMPLISGPLALLAALVVVEQVVLAQAAVITKVVLVLQILAVVV